MVNQEQLEGAWTQIRGKLREKWGQLSDQDLETFHGNVDQLVGLIERKTGDARQKIESQIDELVHQSASTFTQASESMRSALASGEDFVQSRPAQSLGIVFGTGLYWASRSL